MRLPPNAHPTVLLPQHLWRLSSCRSCGAPLTATLLDLGLVPAGDAGVRPEDAGVPVPLHPMHVLVCEDCGLVQLADHADAPNAALPVRPEPRCGGRRLAAALVERFRFEEGSEAGVIGQNERGLSAALAAQGLAVLPLGCGTCTGAQAGKTAVFGSRLARRLRALGHAPALICARGTLAEAADPHDVAAGCRILLAPGGVLLLEVPHLLRMMCDLRFDAFRLELLSYFSLASLEALLAEHDLVAFDVEEVWQEDALLRVFVRHAEDGGNPLTTALAEWRAAEAQAGLQEPSAPQRFASSVADAKCSLLDFLIGARQAGRSVVGYGAPASADRLLAGCGVGPELLPFTVDPLPGRQGLRLPASRIPVLSPSAITEHRPDFVLRLAWSGPAMSGAELDAVRRCGSRIVSPLPRLDIS